MPGFLIVVEYGGVYSIVLLLTCPFTDTLVLSNPFTKVAGSNTHVLILTNETAIFIANERLQKVRNSIFEREKGGNSTVVCKHITDVQLWVSRVQEFLQEFSGVVTERSKKR